MGISANHLSYSDFVKNEIKTLGVIQGLTSLVSSFPILSSNASTFFNVYKNKGKRSKTIKNNKHIIDHPFKFNSELELDIEGKRKKIIIEVLVQPNFSEVTYQLIILELEGVLPTLMRKFHFDFAPYVKASDKQPVYHLQYGGHATPKMVEKEIEDSHILPWLSVPRIAIAPMNFALFLDMILCEFKSEATNKISETNEWRQLIKTNEDLLIKCYYERIGNFFTSNHKSSFLFRDFCYGKK